MKKGNIKVEQIHDGKVLIDYDQTLNKNEIVNLLNNIFKSSLKIKDNMVVYSNGSGKSLAIYFKNITYLGHPHPISKKRIQVPKEYRPKLEQASTLLLGVYHYEEKLIISIFSSFDYIYKKMNNSSAHINIGDLLHCSLNGKQARIDENKNLILVFDEYHIESFLEKYLIQHENDNDIEELAIWMRVNFL
jgi:hypothetical protein